MIVLKSQERPMSRKRPRTVSSSTSALFALRAVRRGVWLMIIIATLWAISPLSFFSAAMPLAYAAGNLTVKVYTDNGRDGVDTGGTEPGISAVTVAVYSADNLLQVQNNTDANGLISFPNLPDGDYRIEVFNIGNRVVSVPGAANTNPGLVSRVQITPAGATVRIGLRPLVSGIDTAAPAATRSVTTRVWDDLDGDGIQDANEPGISGLTLELIDGSNTVLQTATAGADGRYRFDTAPATSNLRVRVANAPAGYTLTVPNSTDGFPFPDGRDSDAVLTGFPPAVVSLPPPIGRGVNDDSTDIGFTRAAISGYIWRDINNNGLYEATTESLTNGVTVQLVDGGGNVVQTTTTRTELGPGGNDGFYRFSGLAFGTYTVRVPNSQFQAGALLFGAANSINAVNGDQASPDGLPGSSNVEIGPFTLSNADIANGSHINNRARFGFYKGSVGDFVWFDLNRDGLQAGEENLGQNGLLLFVDDGRGGGTANNGIRDGGEISTVTDNDPSTGQPGFYLFDDLPLGSGYRIVLDSSNFAPGAPLEGFGSSTATLGTLAGGGRYFYIDTPNLTAASSANFNIDFGLTRADIGNFVFEDRDGNGFFNPGDRPIANVTVQLFRNNDNALIATTTTNATGVYTLPNLPALPYYATFDLSTTAVPTNTFVASPQLPGVNVDPDENDTPTPFVDYSDVITQVNTTTWRTPVFTPAAGQINAGVDAGFYGLTSLTGRAFFDTNLNNQDEATPEPGMRSITVQLRRNTSGFPLVATTTTAANNTGVYTFTNVAPGSYVVDFINPDPSNFTFVTPDIPTAGDPLASDVSGTGTDPNSGRTAALTVTSATPVADTDAGFRGQGAVSGRVFLDNDASNTQNVGDLDLAGATVTLTVTANLTNLVATYSAVSSLALPTAATNPNYTFPGLPGGSGVTYNLAVTPPTASPPYQPSTADQGGNDTLDSDGPNVTVSNPTAGALLDFDQGYFQNVTITARVFEENSGAAINNQYAVGDTGIANVTVALELNDGTPVTTGTTNATGVVTFTVRPGNYRLNIDQTDTDLNGLIPSPGHTDPVAVAGSPLTSGQSSLTDTNGNNSFGYYRGATLTGRVFFDRNLDNLQASEPGVQNVTVSLVSGPSTPGPVTTDATGTYTVTGLLPGNYVVRFSNPDTANFAFISAGDSNVVLPGAFPTSDTGSISVGYNSTVSSGANAGLIGRSSVNGYTFVDGNANGLSNDAVDSAFNGVTATLTTTVNISGRLNTTIVRTAATASGGLYNFIGLPGGTGVTFSVAFTPPTATPAWLVTTADVNGGAGFPNDSDSQLTNQSLAPTTSTGRDQGYYQNVTITARVFEENTGTIDNQYQVGNNGIANVTVTLEPNGGGTAVATGTTDATGVITFTARPGNYQLNIDQTDTDLTGLLPSPGHTDPVAVFGTPLTSGQSSLTDTTGRNSFGYYRGSTITGRVFFDRNLDNLLTGEPGVQGVSVTVTGPSTPSPVTTDATGRYTVTNLLAGNYTVTFSNPDLSNFAFIAGGDSDVTIPGANPTGSTGSISVGYNTTVSGNSDAGLIGRSTVSGNTFVDGNYNGLQGDAADTVLNGVTVNLTATVNITNRLTTTITRTVTTAAGVYSFASLPGGAVTFNLGFTPPTATPAWQVTLADVGADDTIDSDGAAQLTNQALGAGATQDRDQGYYQNVTITARVFEENTGTIDNQYQAGNNGIANVTVTLEPNGGGAAVATGTTNATGLITFTVAPGNYQLNIDQTDTDLTGFVASPGNTDPVAVFGTPLTSGQTSFTDTTGRNSFGYYRGSTITGRVFFDRNLDNLLTGEPGVQGVSVTVTGPSTPSPVTTDATGRYTVTNLLAGNYTVTFSNPDLSNFAFIAGGDSDVTIPGANPTGSTGSISVGYNTTVSGNSDAGLIGRSTVSGSTFVDGTADGLQGGTGDGPFNGVTVNLTATVNITNRLVTTITRTVTTAAGDYSFASLPGGAVTFNLGFTPPTATPAWQVTLADQGADDTIDSDGAAQLTNQSLGAGATQDRDQGYYQNVTITARVFEENSTPLNINNQYAAGDAGIANVTVALEPNGGGAAVATGTTNATGVVTFTVRPGNYQLNVDQAAAALTGLLPSPGHTDPVAVFGTPLTSGQTSFTDTTGRNSFGYYRPSSLTGRVFFDRNLDNLLAGEPGVQGVTVNLRDSTGTSVLTSTTTSATGVYTFTNLAAGNYIVEFVNPDATNFAFITGGDSDITNAATGRTGTITVPYGTNLGNVDGGVIGQGTVSGNTFVDGNYNGLQGDPADTVLNGVTVNLTVTVNIANRLNTTITRTATSATGAYSFASLPGGAGVNFSLRFTPPSATPAWQLTLPDVGADDTIDSDGAAALTNQALAAGGTADRDQGYYQPVTISARVFNDTTLPLNNQWNNSENGIANVTVVLETNPAGTAVQTSTTNASGLVTFTVPPGNYRLNIDQADADLSGFAPSPGNNEPTPVAGTPLTSGQSSQTEATPVGTTNVFGYYRPGTVTGLVFFDGRTAAPDNNRAGEPGMPGVTVRLLDNSLAVVTTTTTLATGVYTFTNVAPGNYTVEFVNPDATNFVFSTTVAGDNNVSALSGNNGRTAQFQVTAGSTQTRNAATFGRSSVTGTTFVDGTADGRQGGTGDTTLNGVTVNLTLNVALPNLTTTVTRAATTAGAGAYTFAALPGGASTAQASFNLSFTPPTATPTWNLTTADAPPDDTGDSDSELTNQLLSPNSVQDRDQGYYQNVTITARVFDEQVTVDNTFQTGEPGIAGVTVDLTGPQSTSGATIAPTGLVTLTVRPGSYTLTIPTDPSGFTRSPGNTGTATLGTLTSGQTATTQPFGYYRASRIQGNAWFDSDGNGTLGASEPGMEGITVSLVGSSSGVIITSTTTVTGSYTFTNVAPTGGSFADTSYRICFSLPTNFAYTTQGASLTTDNNSDVNVSGTNVGCTNTFNVGSNNNISYIDAGYIGALNIGNLVWNDLNANGIQDSGEPGLAGVTVTVAITTTGGVINSTNPTITLTTTSTTSTNLAANYQITRVPPAAGFRVVSLSAPFSYRATLSNQGGDDTRDSDPLGGYPVALPPSITDLDFGFYQTAAIGDRVWFDVNGNGTYESGVDAGFPGVTVQLLDASSSTVISTTTSASSGDVGLYQFQDINPGSYAIQFTAPAGYTFVNNGLGQINVDNDNDANLSGRTANFTVASGTIIGTIDAGLTGTGSLSGIAWRDDNANSIRDTSDTGRVQGVSVTLTLTPTGGLSTITQTQNTPADGSYSFANLPPGSYAVSFSPPAGFTAVTPNVGSDDTIDSDAPLATGTLTAGQSVTNVDAGYRQGSRIYIPLILASIEGRPDLVASFTVTPTSPTAGQAAQITVTVTNTGTGPTSGGFWVDFYINPSQTPTVNRPWNEICGLTPCYGIAWYVDQVLQPGQSITLTSTPDSYYGENTVWPGSFAAGTSVLYVLVDSWNRSGDSSTGDPNGSVIEADENNNLAQQNITVTGTSAVPSGLPRPETLPTRPVHPQR